MVVGIMALVAQAERRMISERTKAALAAAQARGTRLGKPKGHQIPRAEEGRMQGAAANAVAADAFAARLRPVLQELEGLSANAAAQELERAGYATAQGGKWSARHVLNLRARLALGRAA